MQTPNVLASALRDGKATPSHYSVFGGTPQSTVSVIDEKEDRVVQKRKLLSGLMDLPAPQHEYSVEIPTLPSNSEKKVRVFFFLCDSFVRLSLTNKSLVVGFGNGCGC